MALPRTRGENFFHLREREIQFFVAIIKMGREAHARRGAVIHEHIARDQFGSDFLGRRRRAAGRAERLVAIGDRELTVNIRPPRPGPSRSRSTAGTSRPRAASAGRSRPAWRPRCCRSPRCSSPAPPARGCSPTRFPCPRWPAPATGSLPSSAASRASRPRPAPAEPGTPPIGRWVRERVRPRPDGKPHAARRDAGACEPGSPVAGAATQGARLRPARGDSGAPAGLHQ